MRFFSKLEGFRFLRARDSRFRTQADFNKFLNDGSFLGNISLSLVLDSCTKLFDVFKCMSSDDKIFFILDIRSSVLPGYFDDELGYFVRT